MSAADLARRAVPPRAFDEKQTKCVPLRQGEQRRGKAGCCSPQRLGTSLVDVWDSFQLMVLRGACCSGTQNKRILLIGEDSPALGAVALIW